VGDGNAVAVYGVVVGCDAAVAAEERVQVSDELVAVEVEVDPVVGAAAFGAA
jgi:hypothetical protein